MKFRGDRSAEDICPGLATARCRQLWHWLDDDEIERQEEEDLYHTRMEQEIDAIAPW